MHTTNKANGVAPLPRVDDPKELKLKFVLPSKRIKKEEDESPSETTTSPLKTIHQPVLSDDSMSMDDDLSAESEASPKKAHDAVRIYYHIHPVQLII